MYWRNLQVNKAITRQRKDLPYRLDKPQVMCHASTGYMHIQALTAAIIYTVCNRKITKV